ncbi:MAG: bifunctional (p)ppGpp synthetase/guanosine-3',5'-bis(diphosphate) 3'-pyrophosphohydrolase [Xanthomonadales bacterium]|nr:bifunctional (p)ppGpp synthetase/guanosine-3',5'-bis(diphosphate) 3'-pyrophosphohydrolase [Xanthomonadales bacterium]
MSLAATFPQAVLDLRDLLNTYLDPDKVAIILNAYKVGADAHAGQTRKSGEAYILHPVEVAGILARMRMDYASVAAAILHDTLEDTYLDKHQLSQQFGDEIAELVDGVTKLDKIKFRTRQEADAESFRKLLLAMSEDLRVIFIKLADRMHNMRTLGAMQPDSRRRIARETLSIYAPIADRLGMNSVKSELEELGFKNLYPWRYKVLIEQVEAIAGERQVIVDSITQDIKKRLDEAGLPQRIIGREKTPYSIYMKMQNQNLSFSDVTDVYAFRIIAQSVPHCYQALGVAHNLYPPKQGAFKDYIALPKANGYQSLHTVLHSPYNVPVEIQIRTEEMDLVAEQGAAAHWLYKSSDSKSVSTAVRARQWLMRLVDIQKHTGDSLEFLEDAKSDLFPDEIFVFTPKGKIISLRKGASALDFAYAIHTQVGDQAKTAIVDKHVVPLGTPLDNGQTINIETDENVQPVTEWLQIVATAKARAAIRHHLKNLGAEDTVSLGNQLLEKALLARNSSLEAISSRRLRKYLKKNRYQNIEELFTDLALGQQLANLTAAVLAPDKLRRLSSKEVIAEALTVVGSEGSALNFGNCCYPIPGDEVMAYLSAGKGVVVHRLECNNVGAYRKHPDRCLDVQWAGITTGTFEVALTILARNISGVLASISASIGDAGANIEKVQQSETNPDTATLLFHVLVQDRNHMAKVIRRLRRNANVLRVTRKI